LDIAQRPTIVEEKVSDTRSRFVLGPLEPGFGYTLGNSLRRTLLSSIPGAAVTNIRIDGVLHEFSTVPGVTEDVTDIILNLKSLVVTSDVDEPVTILLRAHGKGLATAANIQVPAGVEVTNPDLVVATLNHDDAKLDIEMTVERGRGYVSAVQNKSDEHPIGVIPVDSIYTPVVRVAYKVEPTRVGQRTDFDKLNLDVETKPGTLPAEALASAAKTLVGLFGIPAGLADVDYVEVGDRPDDDRLNETLARSVDDLELTVRSLNCLKREGVHTIGELVARSEADLLDIRNFGGKSIQEVKEKLAEWGLGLKDSPPGFDPLAAVDSFAMDDDPSLLEDEQH
jgi:DNA-directed RNA polymerase subunit alpha